MRLARYATHPRRWAADGSLLPPETTLESLLGMRRSALVDFLRERADEQGDATVPKLAPVEAGHEVWASGVTYLRSRVEREAESSVADVYARVYAAPRPELFFKSVGRRVVGDGGQIRIRRDSDWNVPEPELTLVLNAFGEIVGYTAGNDVSSRSIEGENPLYLPQAKSYDGSCALGPEIVVATEEEMRDLPIHLSILRSGEEVFAGDARISQMKRSLSELAGYLFRETAFPDGAFLMTGTGIVPTQEFTLMVGDVVSVTVGEITLTNAVG